jgi:hypothetical protein
MANKRNDWDQSDWYMGEGISDELSAGLDSEPTDSLEVFVSNNERLPLGNVLSKSSRLNIPLSPKSQNKMMRNVVEIFELEEDSPHEDVEMGEDDDEPVVDLEDQRRRTERLRGVLPALAQLWWSDSDQIGLAAEKLGDGSRDRKLLFFQNIVHHSSVYAEFLPVSSADAGCKVFSKITPSYAMLLILVPLIPILTNFSKMADTIRGLGRPRLLLRPPQEPYPEIFLENSCSACDWQLMRRYRYEKNSEKLSNK